MATLGDKEYFKGISEIKYEGKKSDNPLAFKWYNPDQKVAGKAMRDHLNLPSLTGIPSADKVRIRLAQEHRISHGTSLPMPLKPQKRKRMPLLSSSPKWASITSVSTILI